ncbi:MAG: hypothetical protein QXP01_08120 [Candidatus Hadarchaeum sp.]
MGKGRDNVLTFKRANAKWADISKAERLLGWRPTLTLEQSLSRVVEWYKQNRAWARNI